METVTHPRSMNGRKTVTGGAGPGEDLTYSETCQSLQVEDGQCPKASPAYRLYIVFKMFSLSCFCSEYKIGLCFLRAGWPLVYPVIAPGRTGRQVLS